MSDIPLIAVVALAFSIEATLGFGATLVTMTFGAFLLPPSLLLPAFVPVNIALSTALVVRERRHIDGGLLVRRVLPPMLLGMPIGMTIVRAADPRLLIPILGGAIALLSALQLARRSPPPLAPWLERACVGGAGVMHGAFGTGGPLVVYALSRIVREKAVFRSTLAALWLGTNVILATTFVIEGRINAESLARSARLVVGLAVGYLVGDRAFRAIDPALFGRIVWAALFVAGAVLVLR